MTVVLLISILSTALASSQRIIEGAVGSMDSKKESANDKANNYEINKDIGNIEIKEAGMGSDGISKMEGFPSGVTAEFNEVSNILTIKEHPKKQVILNIQSVLWQMVKKTRQQMLKEL